MSQQPTGLLVQRNTTGAISNPDCDLLVDSGT